MQAHNQTPFPAVSWKNADANKQWHISSFMRVKYRLKQGKKPGEWILRLNPDQGKLFTSCVYYEDDISKPIRFESDFVTYKQHTDVVVNAISHSPTGETQNDWVCGLDVISASGEMLNRAYLKVCGEHQWEKKVTGWKTSKIKAVTQVSLRYDHAYGGKLLNPDKTAQPTILICDEYNSFGTGIKHKDMVKEPYPAHQINWAEQDPQKQGYAAGFGFTHRTWQPRISHAGTYDQDWLDNQHPYPPQDFDHAHHQAASPPLIMQGYIKAQTKIHLKQLMGKHPHGYFRIPELHCFVEQVNEIDQVQLHKMNIDTVIIDVEDEDENEWAVYLSYRHFTPIRKEIKEVTFKYLPTELLAEQKQEKEREEKRETSAQKQEKQQS